MGCGASKEDIDRYNSLLAERDHLALEKADLVRRIELLELSLHQFENQSNEQLNMYRFKIEVLVQMLAIEEKKQQTAVKRLETLKLALLSQGVSNKTMTNILSQTIDSNSPKDEKSILLTSAFDLSGAMERMTEEIASGAEDIIYSFADVEGKIVSALPREDFMRYLYNATNTLTKADVQILSLRFYDGQTVCVPEFIDFFTQSPNSRVARSAAAAVRASLNFLQLQNGSQDEELLARTENQKNETKNGPQTRLHLAVQRLVSLWSLVGESLRNEFNDIEQNVGGGHVVSVDTFKEVLTLIAGEHRSKEKSAAKKSGWDALRSEPPQIHWLREDDINLIASRFELGNRIDVKVFFDFFQDSDEKMATGSFTCEQFKFSEEWSTLRRSTKRELVTLDSSHLSVTDDDEEVSPRGRSSKWEVARNARKQLAVINALKPPPGKGKTDSKPPLGKQSPPEQPSTSAPTTPIPSPRKPLADSDPTGRPPLLKRKSSRVAEQTLAITYSKDPKGFEEELERRVEVAGYLFTKATLKTNLTDLSPLTTEREIDLFVNELQYPGGTVSSMDVVSLLKERWDALRREHQRNVGQGDQEQVKHIQASKSAISSRESAIISLKQQAMLDPIAQSHKHHPKSFVQALTSATETGKGTALTKEQLSRALRNLIPSLPPDIEESFLSDLQPKFRSKTSDVLITSVTSLLKERAAASAKIEKQITAEEKALIADRERSKRMEERAIKIEKLKKDSTVDSITSLYKINPSNFKKFLDQYSVEQKGKTIKYDELKSILQSVVLGATESEIDTLKAELASRVDSKSNELVISALIAHLKAKSDAALKIYKELQREEKAQVKDADAAAGKKSGGFCGGSTKDVHDPSKAPQEAPSRLPDPVPPKGEHSSQAQEPPVAGTATSTGKTLPPPNSLKMQRNSTRETVDTLTYSEGGEDKSDDKEEDKGAPKHSGFSRWRQSDGIGFTEPKKPQRIQRIRKTELREDDDTLDSGSQQSADLFDSDDNDEGDPFSSMEKK